MKRELSFWLLVIVFLAGAMALGYVAHASEVTYVYSDGTKVRTVHNYSASTANWEDDAAIRNPVADMAYVYCFDRIKYINNRMDRHMQIDKCLSGVAA